MRKLMHYMEKIGVFTLLVAGVFFCCAHTPSPQNRAAALIEVEPLFSASREAAVAASPPKNSVNSCEAFSSALADIASDIVPAVVFIKAEQAPRKGQEQHPPGFTLRDFQQEWLNQFFGGIPQQPPKQPGGAASGSGFFISPHGYIATNAHVVEVAAEGGSIEVTLNDGSIYSAELIGADKGSDVALLKINGDDFPYLNFRKSADLRVGELTIVVGSPYELMNSLSMGVVSAIGRNLNLTDWECYIQTDAAINPGNSGGPVCDLSGRCVGMATAVMMRNGGMTGLGFCIPADIIQRVTNDLRERGFVPKGLLGVQVQEVDKGLADAMHLAKPQGVLVSSLVKGGAAEKGGIQVGDLILECNGELVKSPQGLKNIIAMLMPGDQVIVKLLRSGSTVTMNITLEEVDPSPLVKGGIFDRIGIEEIREQDDDLHAEFDGQSGIIITKIRRGSDAYKSGLRPGAVLLMINQQRVTDFSSLQSALKSVQGTSSLLMYARQGHERRYYSIVLKGK